MRSDACTLICGENRFYKRGVGVHREGARVALTLAGVGCTVKSACLLNCVNRRLYVLLHRILIIGAELHIEISLWRNYICSPRRQEVADVHHTYVVNMPDRYIVCRAGSRFESVYAVLGADPRMGGFAGKVKGHDDICGGGVHYLSDFLTVKHKRRTAFYLAVIGEFRAEHADLLTQREQHFYRSVRFAALNKPAGSLDYFGNSGFVVCTENGRAVRINISVFLMCLYPASGLHCIGVTAEQYALTLSRQPAVDIEAV